MPVSEGPSPIEAQDRPVLRLVRATTEPLTAREIDVLSLLAAGASNDTIGARLYLGRRTVETHISRIFDKLGLPFDPTINRRVCAAIIWERYLLEVPSSPSAA